MRRVEDAIGVVRASRNILLERLPPGEQALVGTYAEEVTAERGARLIGPDEPLDAVFFPGTALMALEEEAPAGALVELALVGREGMLGWPALLGSGRLCHAATARMRSGTLLRVPLAPLRSACERSPTLLAALLQFVHVMIVQLARAVAAVLHFPIDRRVARWLLMRHDRIGGDLLAVQHDEIAGSLHVRRASVTDTLHILEGERLVRCTRGRIVVRDRSGLERFAGESYGVAEAQYRLLIAPFGKSPFGA